MSRDTELLRQYVEEHAESAFTELVREHLDLVYSAALRETNGDGALAEDISQAVFAEPARKARRLLGHPTLAAWLYTTVRHLAANVRRTDQRRRRREEEAGSMKESLSEDSPKEVWEQIRPVLDDALHELNEADRAAVVRRFLEDRPLREIAARLRLTENTARMRVDRALEKLRGLLARRGITSTASGLAAALAIGAVTTAPATLAATVASTALASGAAAGSAALALLETMSTAKLKVSVIGALVVAGVAVPLWQHTRLQRVQAENAQLRAQGADGSTNQAAGPMGELMKHALEQQVAGRVSRMAASLHLTPEQTQAARDILMRQAQAASAGMMQVMSGEFNKDELAKLGRGNPEEQIKALLTADQRAAYASYQQEEAANNARVMANGELLQMQASLGLSAEQQDRVFAALYEANFNQLSGSATQTFAAPGEQMQWALDQKAKVLESVLTAPQLENYRQQQSAQLKLLKDILGKIEGADKPK
jgi:RNA polymerase sigma factor (sigma-70 family)